MNPRAAVSVSPLRFFVKLGSNCSAVRHLEIWMWKLMTSVASYLLCSKRRTVFSSTEKQLHVFIWTFRINSYQSAVGHSTPPRVSPWFTAPAVPHKLWEPLLWRWNYPSLFFYCKWTPLQFTSGKRGSCATCQRECASPTWFKTFSEEETAANVSDPVALAPQHRSDSITSCASR